MKVLLTGATGYTGRVVAEALRTTGHEVTGLARSPEAEQAKSGLGWQPHAASLLEELREGSYAGR